MIKQKIAALDLGDQWTGVAISDNAHIIATPFETVKTENLHSYLQDFITKQNIKIIVIGIPITVRGQESEQTKKTKLLFAQLQIAFPQITFIAIDERFSSKQASELQKTKKKGTWEKIKEEKLKNHAIAASFILDTYLQRLQFERDSSDDNG